MNDLEWEQQDPEGEAAERKRDLRIVVVWAVIVMILLICGVTYLRVRKVRVPLNDYLTIAAEGYDSVGTAAFSFDMEAYLDDFRDTIQYRGGKANTTVGEYANAAEALIHNCVGGSLNRQSDLSNGDTVTFMWDCREEIASEDYHCVLVYSNIEKKVQDLEEPEGFDPFTGIRVEFSGISPDGTASVDRVTEEGIYGRLTYTLSRSSGLSNGDEVKVTVASPDGDVADMALRGFGKYPTSLEKTYRVSGLTAYVTELGELTDAVMQDMRAKAEEVFIAEEVPSWRSGAELLNREYLGSYLLVSSGSADIPAEEAQGAIIEELGSGIPTGISGIMSSVVSDGTRAPITWPFGLGGDTDDGGNDDGQEEEGEQQGFKWSDLFKPSFYGFGSDDSEEQQQEDGSGGSGGQPHQAAPSATPVPTPEASYDWQGIQGSPHTEEFDSGTRNIVYLVYRVDTQIRGSDFSFFTYTAFADLQVMPDGSIDVDLQNYRVPSGSSILGESSGDIVSVRKGLFIYHFSGFATLDDLYRRCVYEHRDLYDYETSVG